MTPYRHLLVVLLAGTLSACTLAKVDVNVVSERTSLENQVLGTYNTMNDDLLLIASVRGVSPTGKIAPAPQRSPEQEGALRAMETISFHADDVDNFKRLGWIGEDLSGHLHPFERTLPVTAKGEGSFTAYSAAEFQQILSDVNAARDQLMLRVIQTNENFTREDLPKVRQVFARINQQGSPPGTKIQRDDGTWGTL